MITLPNVKNFLDGKSIDVTIDECLIVMIHIAEKKEDMVQVYFRFQGHIWECLWMTQYQFDFLHNAIIDSKHETK